MFPSGKQPVWRWFQPARALAFIAVLHAALYAALIETGQQNGAHHSEHAVEAERHAHHADDAALWDSHAQHEHGAHHFELAAGPQSDAPHHASTRAESADSPSHADMASCMFCLDGVAGVVTSSSAPPPIAARAAACHAVEPHGWPAANHSAYDARGPPGEAA